MRNSLNQVDTRFINVTKQSIYSKENNKIEVVSDTRVDLLQDQPDNPDTLGLM